MDHFCTIEKPVNYAETETNYTFRTERIETGKLCVMEKWRRPGGSAGSEDLALLLRADLWYRSRNSAWGRIRKNTLRTVFRIM